jgi:hypothetical protein
MLVGEAVTTKSAPATTVRGTIVLRVIPNLPVAVMVTFVVVPADAVLSAVKVRVEFPLPGNGILPGLKVAVTPAGNPEADKTISAFRELSKTATVTVVLAEPAWVTETLAGDALTEKPGLATLKLMWMVCVVPPPDAVMGIVKVPFAAVLLADRVSVEVPEPGAGRVVGLRTAVTPRGSPEKERLTLELKPPSAVMEIADVVEFPG